MVYDVESRPHTICMQIVHGIVRRFVCIIGHVYTTPKLVYRKIKTRHIARCLLNSISSRLCITCTFSLTRCISLSTHCYNSACLLSPPPALALCQASIYRYRKIDEQPSFLASLPSAASNRPKKKKKKGKGRKHSLESRWTNGRTELRTIFIGKLLTGCWRTLVRSFGPSWRARGVRVDTCLIQLFFCWAVVPVFVARQIVVNSEIRFW
jgi:hypothetical protein